LDRFVGLPWYFFAIIVCSVLFPSALAANYYYESQQFIVNLYEGGGQMYVSQAITLYCFEGFVEKINITLPYGRDEMLNANDTLVQTTAAKSLDKRVIQSDNQTIVEVKLPDKIYAGDSTTVIMRYYIYDIPGEQGISKVGKKTLGDKILGRTGKNTLVTFKTPVFEAAVNELVVKIFPPLDYIPKDWEPPLDSAKAYDPATGRVAIIWHITTNIPTQGQYQVLFGKPGWGITAFLVIGLLVVVFLYLTVDMMNRLREKAERGELW